MKHGGEIAIASDLAIGISFSFFSFFSFIFSKNTKTKTKTKIVIARKNLQKVQKMLLHNRVEGKSKARIQTLLSDISRTLNNRPSPKKHPKQKRRTSIPKLEKYGFFIFIFHFNFHH